MQILTVGGSRSDLSDMMDKLQQALVPQYFESATLTPCEGTSPTQVDPSIITFKYSDVYIDLYIGNATTADYIEFRGDGISGTGKIRANQIASSYPALIITDIIVTDSGVALVGRYNNTAWNTITTFIVIGKNADGRTCVFAPAQFSSIEPWSISYFIPSIASTGQNYLYSMDLSAGKVPNDYTELIMPPQKITTTSTLIMASIPTLNGKPFKDVYFPKYNPFSNHPEPFHFTMGGAGFAAVAGCNFIFRDDE